MRFTAITLFPEMFDSFLENGVVGRAVKRQLVQVECLNPRDFTHDKHRTVDDRPYGGGPGMLMLTQPLLDAISAAKQQSAGKVIYLSPQGRKLDHQKVVELSHEQHLILIAGRYEGIDERVIESQVDEEISLGDFVLSGGEIPALALIDSVTRLLPEVLGHDQSATEDSFVDGLLDHSHYTRPEEFEGRKVPSVLLSGDHAAIKRWRLQQALGRTWERRPDLLEKRVLTAEEEQLLNDYKAAKVAQPQPEPKG